MENIITVTDTSLQVFFPDRVVPKQRPREVGKKFILPEGYRKWKDKSVSLVKYSWKSIYADMNVPPLITLCSIDIKCYGKFLGDWDNISGAILDTLVQAKVLLDDSVKHIAHASFGYFPNLSEEPHALATISHISYYYDLYNCPDNHFEQHHSPLLSTYNVA